MAKSRWKRRLVHIIALPLLKLIFFLIWRTCRIEKTFGEEHFERLLQSQTPFIPCYWHQRHLFCARYMFNKMAPNQKLGFLISPSADGDVAARLTESWGGIPIRGSTTRTGAKAMRDLYETIVKQKISPVITPDGPTGPAREFKQGAVMLSQLTQVPMLPMAYAASAAWQLGSWDKFMIPKPFSRIVIAIGAPRQTAKGLKLNELEPLRLEMEQTLNKLLEDAEQGLLPSGN